MSPLPEISRLLSNLGLRFVLDDRGFVAWTTLSTALVIRREEYMQCTTQEELARLVKSKIRVALGAIQRNLDELMERCAEPEPEA